MVLSVLWCSWLMVVQKYSGYVSDILGVEF